MPFTMPRFFRPKTQEASTALIKDSSTEPSRIEVAFGIIYGHAPTDAELRRFADYQIDGTADWPRLFRRLIAINDRQALATPFLIRFSEEDVEFFEVEGFRIALDTADDSVSLPLKYSNGIEKNVVAFLKQNVRSGMHFVDVGANIGFFSMLASNLVGSSGRVHAFEPNSENCRLLMLSRERNSFSQLALSSVALGREAGTAFFSPHYGSNGGFIDQASAQLLNPQCVVVPVAKLDDMVTGRVDFMKMDVEGAEALVLQGAEDILANHRPIIIAEFSQEMISRISNIDPKAYLEFIISKGYEISRLEDEGGAEIVVNDLDYLLSPELGDYAKLHELVFRPKSA